MNKIKKYRFELFIVALFSLLYVIFCNYLMIELPHLTWFDQFHLIEKYYNKSISYKDFFTTYGEHGLFGYNIIFLLNVIVLKLSTMFDVYMNDLNVFIVGSLSIYILLKQKKEDLNLYLYRICVITCSVFLFSFMQLSSAGGMETQVRLGILFFFIVSFLVDKIFKEEVKFKYLLYLWITMFLSINIFGTLYSYAAYPFYLIISIILYFKKESRIVRKNIVKTIGIYTLCCILYILQYDLFSKGGFNNSDLGIFERLIKLLLNPLQILYSLFSYNASSVFGYAALVDGVIPDKIYLFTGFVVSLVFFYSIFLFFKNKMYHKTVIPFLFIGYSFFVFVLTLLGRGDGSWEWFANYWYNVHTKFAPVGSILIVYMYNTETSTKSVKFKKLNNIIVCVLLFLCLLGNCIELRRAPHERTYYMEKQPYLFAESIDELPIDTNGNTPLLHSKEMTWKCINYMKMYNLSVYKYYDSYRKMREISKNLEKKFNKIKGLYDDYWVEKESEFQIKTGNKGEIFLDLTFPKDLNGDEKVTVSIDGVRSDLIIKNKNDKYKLVTDKKNKIVTITMISNFEFKADYPDKRMLSFILNDVYSE